MKHLLIIWHSRTGYSEHMALALAKGATHTAEALEQAHHLHVQCQTAHETTEEDLLRADGYLFCAPENLGTLSGEMKECFDRNYYAVLDQIQGKPYAIAISAGTDGQGAARQLERICTGWRLRSIAPALIERNGAQSAEAIMANKVAPPDTLARCQEYGGLLAATLLAGEL